MHISTSLIWKLGLSALLIAGVIAASRLPRVQDDSAAEPADVPPIIHIHHRDIRGRDASGELLIRCRFCAGSKKVWHYTAIMRGDHILNQYRDGTDPCPACHGTGVVSANLVPGIIQVVPDDRPSDYNEARAVREEDVVKRR